MRKILLLLAMFAVGILFAQTFGPPTIGSDGPIATSPSQCPTAAAHAYSLCPVETGAGTGALYISINGAAPVLLQGAPGPAGPTGPAGPPGATGPAGAQGPAGPVQSFLSITCAPASLGTSGLTGSNCAEK